MSKQQLEEHAGEEPRWIRKCSYFVIVSISGYLLLGGLYEQMCATARSCSY
jgi:hypothetical protein